MKRLFVAAAMVLLAGSMTAATINTAEARNGQRGALIAGLIIGGVAAGILASQVQRQYHQPQYYAYRGQRVRFGHGQMWQQHVHYCYNRYRSYNHHTNLFLAYSGRHHHCRSPWIQ
ncbi:MAG: BA14K family protein [Devosiaceae bacterium]